MNLWTQVDSNIRRSYVLIAIFIALVIGIGWLFSYVYNSYNILIIAVLVAVIQALVSYFSGDKIILTISGARQIQKSDNQMLWNLVENLSITAGLPMPKVYIINDPAPNAFATGRDPKNASIAVTTGLLERLEKVELEGVLAHELSHVGNYDIRLMMITAILVGVVALISDLFIRARIFGFGGKRDENSGGGQIQAILLVLSILAAILAPLVATLIQLAISRKREYLADADGALLTRFPEGLARALEKISMYKQPLQHASSATAHLYISNPLGDEKTVEKEDGFFTKIFSTHPPIKERVRILRGM